MATFEKSTRKTCLTSSCSVPDFLARVSLLQGEDLDSKIQEVLSSLTLPESLQRNGLHFYSWKMSPVCYRMTTAGRLLPSSPRLLKWGIMALHDDGTICFLGWAGRMSYHYNKSTIKRIDYEKYIDGKEDYLI